MNELMIRTKEGEFIPAVENIESADTEILEMHHEFAQYQLSVIDSKITEHDELIRVGIPTRGDTGRLGRLKFARRELSRYAYKIQTELASRRSVKRKYYTYFHELVRNALNQDSFEAISAQAKVMAESER